MIAYVLETIVCSALFLALYRLLIAGKVAPLPSRIFLVGTMILSAVIPALNLPILPAKAQYVQIPVTAATAESLSAAADNPASVSVWQVVVITIYITVTLIFLALLCRDLIKIARLRRKGTISRKSGYTLVENDAVTSPFTFWRTVFIGGGMEPRERKVVLAHESSHARHLHTVDKLLLSLLRAVYWFNPFYWMALSSLAQLQEWEADRDTLEGGVDLQTFRMTIFKQMFGYYPDLSSALVQGPLKKRFAMMVGGIKSRRPALRLGTALPLAALLVVMFGATACPSSGKTQDGDPTPVKKVTAVEVDSTGNTRRIVDIKAVTETDTIVGVANLLDSTVSIVVNKDSVVSYIVNGKEIPVERIIRIDKSTAPAASVRKKDSATVVSLNKDDSKKFLDHFGAKTRDSINDAVIVVRGDDSHTSYTVNGVVVPKDSLKRIDASKIESVNVNKEQNRISVKLKEDKDTVATSGTSHIIHLINSIYQTQRSTKWPKQMDRDEIDGCYNTGDTLHLNTVADSSVINPIRMRLIAGKVKNADNRPLANAIVQYCNSNNFASTDPKGRYEIIIPCDEPDAKLEFSMIGKRTVVVPVTGGKMKDVILEDEPIALPGTTIEASAD